MGKLDRYKKAGGFVQLLSLIETFGPEKQDKFLALIEEESKPWAAALKSKILTIEKIFSWEPATLAEIVAYIPPKNLAAAMHGLSQAHVDRLLANLSHSEKRKIEYEFKSLNPNPGEVATALVKIIEAVRGMIKDGYLHLEKVAVDLIIDEKFEERLLHAQSSSGGSSDHSHASGEQGKEAVVQVMPLPQMTNTDEFKLDPKLAAEIKTLQATVINLTKENRSLKGEMKVLKDKLEQIKRIA